MRPATKRQKQKLKFFGVSTKRSLTIAEASRLIEEAMKANPDRETTWQYEKKDEDGMSLLDLLADRFNDEDVREVCHYKVLTKTQLRQFDEYLKAHVPDAANQSRFDLGDLIPKLFPDRAKIERAKQPARRKRRKPSVVTRILRKIMLGR